MSSGDRFCPRCGLKIGSAGSTPTYTSSSDSDVRGGASTLSSAAEDRERALVEALQNIVDFERDLMDDDLYSFHRLQEIARAALDQVRT